jgi:crotonobetainyl-CoA:carnitine CoA-transferase CaiB-like acyl-CoA transferase
MSEPPTETLLTDCRVLDCAGELGALCGRILGDLGADVIKIEPPGGDPARHLGPFVDGIAHPDRSLRFWAANANKRSAVLDLDTRDGAERLRGLAAGAHIVVDSEAPGVMARRGLDHAALAERNPGIITVSITPFGEDGPRSGWRGPDLVLAATSGQVHLNGDEDRPPVRISIPQAAPQAGAQAAMTALIARHRWRRTGRGQHIDVSVQECLTNTLLTITQAWDLTGRLYRRGARTGWGPILQRTIWSCRDGFVAWKWFVGKQRGRRNDAMVRWMRDRGFGEGLAGEDWEGHDLMQLTQEMVDRWEEAFAPFFAAHTTDELYRGAIERRIMLCPVSTPAAIRGNEQLAFRRFFRPVRHPELQRDVEYPGPFAQMSAGEPAVRRRPPLLGEHTDEVLAELAADGASGVARRS